MKYSQAGISFKFSVYILSYKLRIRSWLFGKFRIQPYVIWRVRHDNDVSDVHNVCGVKDVPQGPATVLSMMMYVIDFLTWALEGLDDYDVHDVHDIYDALDSLMSVLLVMTVMHQRITALKIDWFLWWIFMYVFDVI